MLLKGALSLDEQKALLLNIKDQIAKPKKHIPSNFYLSLLNSNTG
jgi:hypothetical protein